MYPVVLFCSNIYAYRIGLLLNINLNLGPDRHSVPFDIVSVYESPFNLRCVILVKFN